SSRVESDQPASAIVPAESFLESGNAQSSVPSTLDPSINIAPSNASDIGDPDVPHSRISNDNSQAQSRQQTLQQRTHQLQQQPIKPHSAPSRSSHNPMAHTWALRKPGKNFWSSILSQEIITDLGLVQTKNAFKLLSELMVPLIFTACITVYLRCYHGDFTRLAYLAEESDFNLSTPLTLSGQLTQRITSESSNRNSSEIPSDAMQLASSPNSSFRDRKIQSERLRQLQQPSNAESFLIDIEAHNDGPSQSSQPTREQTSSHNQEFPTTTTKTIAPRDYGATNYSFTMNAAASQTEVDSMVDDDDGAHVSDSAYLTNSRKKKTWSKRHTLSIKKRHRHRNSIDELNDTSVNELRSSARSMWSMIESCLETLLDTISRLLQTHFIKLVIFFIFRLAIIDVSLINVPFLILAVAAFKFQSFERCACILSGLLSACIIILRMTYNLTSFQPFDITYVCPANAPPPHTNATYHVLMYVGLDREVDILPEIVQYLIVLGLLTIQAFVHVHLNNRRDGKSCEATFGIIFPNVGRREADQSLIKSLMYFVNFGFYMFGIEITCLALVLAISNRLDALAFFYGLSLVAYLLRLGLPPMFCQNYIWSNTDIIVPDLRAWLYLPDFSNPPEVKFLYLDFLVFLTICRQMIVFRNSNPSSLAMRLSLSTIETSEFYHKYLPSTDEYKSEDCFTNYSTPNNFLKSVFFMSMYWITLAGVLVAGATKVSLYSLGYLLGCFVFLWLGNDTYLMPTRKLILRWNWFVFYSTFVISSKSVLQLFACIYNNELLQYNCYLLQLLRVVCYKKIPANAANTINPSPAEQCLASLPYAESDLLWDGLCLFLLLVQRIVFDSQYFRHLVLEVKAQQILASRGAELILATQLEEAKAQQMTEKEVMRSIKAKMENLKSDQIKSNAWQTLMLLPYHHQVIRNADKHLFGEIYDDDDMTSSRRSQTSRKNFIPDPIGDELGHMVKINGISAVFSRWMRGEALFTPLEDARKLSSDTVSSSLGHSERQSPTQTPSRSPPQTRESTKDHSDEEIDNIEEAQNEDDASNVGEPGEKQNYVSKVRGLCWTLNFLLYSCLLSATVALNRVSSSYRYVSRRMALEKTALKSQFDLTDERFRTDPLWRKSVISKISETYKQRARNGTRAAQLAQISQASTDTRQSIDSGKTKPIDLPDPEYHFLKTNMFNQFCRALAYVFISNTSLMCYLFIVIDQVASASLLSLPLPLMTFLWGTLSVPRATNRFWKTVITYTELIIVVKYFFQFPLWKWNQNNLNPFYLPNLFGIQDITIVYDLLLLILLFFHRSMLKSLGQWDSTNNAGSTFVLDQAQSSFDPTQPGTSTTARELNWESEFGSRASLGQPAYSTSGTDPTSYVTSRELTPQGGSSIDGNDNLDEAQPQSYQQQMIVYDDDDEDNEQKEVHTKSNKCVCCGPCCRCFKAIYSKIVKSVSEFFHHVLKTKTRVPTDVYTWMFLCDFINFLILIYGFWAFGSGYTNQTVASFLDENRIPFSVLVMLLAQFASIIIDRALYLQKNLVGKLIFQVLLILGVHLWLFFALPAVTGHTLTLKEDWPPKAWYIFKCFHFLLSAHQIRRGYPRRVLGNCFTKAYGYANWGLFKVYRAIPLFYELRLYMDWIWTETTLEFRNWAIMEDMFANLFIRKCELTLEEEYPRSRAKPQPKLSKYLTGGAFILLILAIIWGPLLLFSMGKTVGESNIPVEMEFELEFVGYQPIIRMRATSQSIIPLTMEQYDQLKDKYDSLPSQSFLGDYKKEDVTAIRLNGQSNAVWEISPPSKDLLINSIQSNETLLLKSTWTFYRVKQKKSQNFDTSIAGSWSVQITSNDTAFRNQLFAMLQNSSTSLDTNSTFVTTPPIFPNYVRVPETGQASLATQLTQADPPLRPLRISYIRLAHENTSIIESSTSWWKAEDPCKTDPAADSYPFWSTSLPHCGDLVLVAFNDRIFTGILALLSAPGIIGLYTTFVVFFARLIRTEPAGRVIYTEIPNVDRVYGLILDIYMMRECGQFELEEKLFSKLLFLYRSPELLIEWSRRDEHLALMRQQQLQLQNQGGDRPNE
ncbi:Piezo-type mechanosensitive ion channel component, partial [Fragariocoptes setiger]